MIAENLIHVALVNPNTRSAGRVATTTQPLGLLYIAAVLRERGHRVSFVDADTRDLGEEELLERFEREGVHVLGITATTFQTTAAYRLAEAVKTRIPRILTVLGGAHPSSAREAVLDECPHVDIAVVGEGERTMIELMELVSLGLPVARYGEIAGLCFRGDEGVVFTGPRAFVDVDSLPLPAVDLAPPSSTYMSVFPPPRGKVSAVVMGARGCPFDCSFCGTNQIWGRRVRFRSPRSVLAEIEHLHRAYGVDEIFFLDDTLNASRKWLTSLCELIRESHLLGRVSFKCSLRANPKMVDRSLLRTLREVGFWMVAFGVESGNDGILERAGKVLTVADTRRAFTLAREEGLATLGSFMIGNLGEDRGTVMDTIELAREIRPDYFDFPIATPLPGTRYQIEAERLGLIETRDYADYGMGRSVCRTEHLTCAEIEELQRRAFEMMREFRDGLSVEYRGSWRQKGKFRVGRRDESGGVADLSLRFEKPGAESWIRISYLDVGSGPTRFWALDCEGRWTPVGEVVLENSGAGRESVIRLAPSEQGLPEEEVYLILETEGRDFFVADVAVDVREPAPVAS